MSRKIINILKDRRVVMNIFKNITSGYKKIATGIAIVSFLAIVYIALIPGGTLAVSGVFTSLGIGINGAEVKLPIYPQYNTTTNSNGDYSLTNVPYGTYLISASAPGYSTNISTVTVDGAAVSKNFILGPLGMIIKKSKVLYIPWVNESTTFRSNLQLANPGSVNAVVNIALYDTNGNLLATNSTTLLPNQYLALNSVITWLGVSSPREGYIILDSSEDFIAAGQVIDNSISDPATLNAINLDMLGTEWGMQSVVRGWNWVSNEIFFNPNNGAAHVDLTEYDANGNVLATKFNVVIPGRGSLVVRDIATFMGIAPGNTVGAFKAVSDIPIYIEGEGKQTVTKVSGFADAADLSRTSTIQYIPYVNESTVLRTNIQLANFNSSNTSANISMFDYNGNLLAYNTIELSPNMYVSLNNIITTFLSLTIPKEGYLRIESNRTRLIAAGQVIDNSNSDPATMGMTTTALGSSLTQMMPSVVRGWNWVANDMILNPNDVDANVDLTEYDGNGNVLATKLNVVIPKNGIFIQRDIATYMGVPAGNTVGAWKISSNVPIVTIGEGKQTISKVSGFAYALSIE